MKFQDQMGFDFEPPQPKRPSLIQPRLAREAAEYGMERAMRLSGEDWKIEMLQAIRRVAERMEYFTADHVWEQLGRVGDGKRDDGSGLGPMLRLAAKSGLIRKADIQPSQRDKTHGRPIRLWKSLIFSGERMAVNGR